jgi:hypothetical protein
VDREDLRRWIELYERAWRTLGTDLLKELFAPTATYSPGPHHPLAEQSFQVSAGLGRGQLEHDVQRVSVE